MIDKLHLQKEQAYLQGWEEGREALDIARNQIKAEGCWECAFVEREEWELPCSDCKRNHKDYWRAKPQNEDDE